MSIVKSFNILKQCTTINFNLKIYFAYLTTIQFPSRFDPILSIIFFSCNDLNDLSIVLLVTPIFSASSIDVRLGFSIKSSIIFFSLVQTDIQNDIFIVYLVNYFLFKRNSTANVVFKFQKHLWHIFLFQNQTLFLYLSLLYC